MGAPVLDEIVEQASDKQYTNNLLFSSIFSLMNLVVYFSRSRIPHSVHASFRR